MKRFTKLGRCVRHRRCVQDRVLELRKKIFHDAMHRGIINTTTKALLLKYNNYLIKLHGSK
jgi:hypothetical protein